jgi:hypothetical protein
MTDFISNLEKSFSVKAKAIKVNDKVVMRDGEFQGVRSLAVAIPKKSW